ncbi:MAG: hypothetical protein LPK07_09950 [Hymenobacteraceae bacterium]|mgnify:CR=1 FL=1|nr:hypothetical protein [Hymenobacteraceae bacterium]MDX5481994.1 hypothetical protein [Hymenobacteraceae bacterium]
MDLLFRDEICLIEFDSAQSIMRLAWLQQPDDVNYKKYYTKSLKLAIQYEAAYFLADNSRGTHVNLAMQRWLAETSAAYKPVLHLKRFARVVPQDAFQELVSYKIYDAYDALLPNSMQFGVFNDRALAELWLTGQYTFSAAS